MHDTQRVIANRSEVAIGLRAYIAHSLLLQILAEIEILRREEYTSDSVRKLRVVQLSILILVHVIEDFFELLVCYVKTPVVAKILKLPLLNFPTSAKIEMLKRTLKSFPLELKFTSELKLQISGVHYFLVNFRIFCLIFFERWIFNAIMAEVKAFTFVNGSSHPFAEVVIS